MIADTERGTGDVRIQGGWNDDHYSDYRAGEKGGKGGKEKGGR